MPMTFVVAIELRPQAGVVGVAVPDLPGCFSAGDTVETALSNAASAVREHLAEMIERGESLPTPSSQGELEGHPEYYGWQWATVTVPDPRSDASLGA